MNPSELLAARTRVLELIAAHAELEGVLGELATGLDRHDPTLRSCVLLLNSESRTLHPIAGPSLSPGYLSSVDGVVIGPGIGTCGSAAWSGEPAFTEDIAEDPRWAPIREFVLGHGIRCSWSWPISSAQGRVLGTLAFYGATPGLPDEDQIALMRDSACLAAIAIERDHTIERLTADARIDPLTGLPNRRALMAALTEALARATPEQPVAVLFVDLDNLKTLNDTLGHDRTDEIICDVAARLAQTCGSAATIGRLAGDEFLAVGVADAVGDAIALADGLLEALRAPIADASTVAVSASVGIAMVEEEIEAGEAIRRADSAMYDAKRAGGERWAVFVGPRPRASGRGAGLRRLIDGAETRGEMSLDYEPIVALRGGETVALRARTRWISPEYGEIAGPEIVRVARKAGFVVALGGWALRECCEAVAQLSRRDGRELDALVHIHPLQLAYPGFTHSVARVLRHAGFPAERLTLGISAVSAVDPDPGVASARADLRASGVRLVLVGADTAPIGFGELVALTRSELDGLALGPTIVAGLPDDPVARVVVAGLASLARSTGCALAADGVVSEAQCDALQELGCAYAGGPFARDAAPLASVPARSVAGALAAVTSALR